MLHEKHPILKKLQLATLQTLLHESSVIYLEADQKLYTKGTSDQFIYIVLFGRLAVVTAQSGIETILGKVNLGWTIGEEILFDRNL